MFNETPLLIVDSDKGLKALAQRLAKSRVLGVDTEADSMYAYQEKVCLVQFTDDEGDVIVDPLAIGHMDPLKPIFEDRNIVKVYHGADYDVVSLRRDFGLRSRNLFDTLLAAQFIGLDRLGYADLVDRWFGHKLEKKYQRHDWSRRPLLEEHLDYARGDTHWLPALRAILRRKLLAAGRLEHHREECRLLEKRKWDRKSFDPDSFVRIKRQGELDEDGLHVLRALHAYRDRAAKKLDRPPYKVIGDDILVTLAHKMPETMAALERALPGKDALKRRHAKGLLDAILDGLDDDRPLPKAHARRKKRSDDEDDEGDPKVAARLHGRHAERVTEALKQWRNDLVRRDPRHSPFTVASNGVLKTIARARPTTLEELEALPDVRAWQVRDHGEAILDVLEREAPAASLGKAEGKRKKRR
jgi:ribonuclease D